MIFGVALDDESKEFFTIIIVIIYENNFLSDEKGDHHICSSHGMCQKTSLILPS